jgi:hypothetical protein
MKSNPVEQILIRSKQSTGKGLRKRTWFKFWRNPGRSWGRCGGGNKRRERLRVLFH